MGNTSNPKRIDIYGIDKILEKALERLNLSTDITLEDKTCINQFVEQLFAKNIGKLRAVKYIKWIAFFQLILPVGQVPINIRTKTAQSIDRMIKEKNANLSLIIPMDI